MAIPTSITDLDVNEAMNSPAGSDNVGGTLDNFLRAHAMIIRRQFSKGANVNSASTTVLPPDCSFLNVVKVVSTINGFTDSFDGRIIYIKFDAGITLAHSSALVLPTASNVVTEAGDIACFINEASGVWHCVSYPRLLHDSVDSLAESKVSKAGDQMTGPLKIATGSMPFRIKDNAGTSGRALVMQKDQSSFYLLVTNDGDADGSYNSLRPFQLDLATGAISVPSLSIGGATPWTTANFDPATKKNAGSFVRDITGGGDRIQLWYSAGAIYTRVDATDFGYIWTSSNFDPSSKANFQAICQHHSGTVEFGFVDVNNAVGQSNVDLPGPYVMTGLRKAASTWHVYLRGKQIRNN